MGRIIHIKDSGKLIKRCEGCGKTFSTWNRYRVICKQCNYSFSYSEKKRKFGDKVI